MKKLVGITLIAVTATCELYFMYLMTGVVVQGFLSCLKTLGV